MVNFDFDHFVSILNSLSDLQAHNIFYGDGRRISDITMVFDNEIDDDGSDVDQAVSIPIGMVCEYTEEGDLCQYLQG